MYCNLFQWHPDPVVVTDYKRTPDNLNLKFVYYVGHLEHLSFLQIAELLGSCLQLGNLILRTITVIKEKSNVTLIHITEYF